MRPKIVVNDPIDHLPREVTEILASLDEGDDALPLLFEEAALQIRKRQDCGWELEAQTFSIDDEQYWAIIWLFWSK